MRTATSKSEALQELETDIEVRCVKHKVNRGSGAFMANGKRAPHRGTVTQVCHTRKQVENFFGHRCDPV